MQTIFTILRYPTIKQKSELRLSDMVTPAIMDFWLFIFYLSGMTEHRNSFLKSIISFYYFASSFRYLILKVKKLRQPVTKYIETATFCKGFSLSPFDKCWWAWKLHQDHTVDKLLTHSIDAGEGGVLMEISLSFWAKTLVNCVS